MRNNRKNICIRLLDSLLDAFVFFVFLLLLSYSCYAIWDSRQIYAAGDAASYESYKPEEEDDLSFETLKELNSDVLGWLSVYGTKIDYPLLQGEDNQTYIYTDAQGDYSMAGSIFLDYRNNPSFTDFNTIIFGHHMEKSAMFGDLERFFQKDFFDKHKYGNLYYDGKNHGIEFFSFMEIDAFDSKVYTTPVKGTQAKEEYLETLLNQSTYYRDINISISDRLVLLSTCTENTTNGRHILVGRVTDEVFSESKETKKQTGKQANFHSNSWLDRLRKYGWLIVLFVVLCLLLFVNGVKSKKNKKNCEKDGGDE